MITTLRSRTFTLIALVTLAIFGVASINAPAAFARVDPNGPYPYPATMPTPASPVSGPTVATHAGSGLATWLVVVIAIVALAIGAGLAEVARSVVRIRQIRRPVAIAS
jgi:hypothetical protein